MQFSFNNTMYQQTGAALANIIVGFQEAWLFKITNLSLFYIQYVDDTFVLIFSRFESRRFFNTINRLHPSLTFTCEFEHNNSLPFLDVFVERTNFGQQTLIFRKFTFTKSYTWWSSFCHSRFKNNLIKKP